MVTCCHKRIHQKDLAITGVLIFGAACTHPLIPTMLPRDHPLSSNPALIDRSTKVCDPAFKEQCDAATLNVIHHHQEELMRMLRDELQKSPQQDRNFPHRKLIFQWTHMHAIWTKTKRKLWHQRPCHFSPLLTAQAQKCCNGVPEFKDDALCPILDQCTTCIQTQLKKATPGKDGFNPDTVQLPC